jgi:hypothetical protein
MRTEPVVQFAQRPEPGPVRALMDALQATMGKTASLASVPLLHEATGYTTAAAAGSPGTAVAITRMSVDFADAGIDSVRLVGYGANSGAGSVTLALYDVTNSVTLCTATLTGVANVDIVGAWTTIQPTGSDQVIELRVVGAGETPTLYSVQLHGRTVQART